MITALLLCAGTTKHQTDMRIDREEGCEIQANLTELDREALLEVRTAEKRVQDLEDGLRELELKTISSPNMDGMPKGSSDGDASTRRLISMERAKHRLKMAEKDLRTARRRAERVCRKMDGHMRSFCESYYVDCQPFSVAQKLSGVSERQCYRYMQDIKPEDGTCNKMQ